MINTNSKLAIKTAVFFEIILVATLISSIITSKWDKLAFSILTIVCLVLPFFITHFANKKKIFLPPSFQLVTLLFIFLTQYLGEIKGFYSTFWWWDLFIHAIFGSYVVIISYNLIPTIFKRQSEITLNRFIFFTAITAFSFSITLGAMWEIFEFVGDQIFKSQMIKGGIEDTATDLISNIFTAAITSILYYFKSKSSII